MRDDPDGVVAEGVLLDRRFPREPEGPRSLPSGPRLPARDEPFLGSLQAPSQAPARVAPERPLEGILGLPSLRPEPSVRLRMPLPSNPEDRSAPRTP